MTGTRLRSGARALPLCALSFLLVSACSGSPRRTGVTADVTLRNFSIASSTSTVASGPVTFSIDNQGPATHEFVLVRTNLPADSLPIASDGVTIDEDVLDGVGDISEVKLWDTRTLSLDLAAGRYVFFCNLEGHYLGGMRGSLVVSGHA